MNSIGNSTFSSCSGLTSVTIGNSVNSIGNSAFSGCSGLTSVTIGNSVNSIGNSAFSGCSGLTSVTIGNSVSSIGNSAFYGCTGLISLDFGNSVNSIGNSAFYGCTSLTSLDFGNNLTSIGESAFYGCTALKSVNIGTGVTSIGNSAFQKCSSLTSITIPDGVTQIGDYAFYECYGLRFLDIGNNITSMGECSFTGCNLVSVTFHCKTIKSWFSGFSSIEEIVIGNEVTTIEDKAFYNCNLKSVTIGAGVLSIGVDAFRGSESIGSWKTIWLPNTPPSGYSNAAGEVNYVANDSYASGYVYPFDVWHVYPYLSSLFVVDGVKYVPVSPSERTCDAIDCTYNPSVSHVQIGPTVFVKGIELTVGKINPYTFYFNTSLNNVQIGDGIKEIGEYAFAKCTILNEMEIPDAVTTLGEAVFFDCKAMKSVKIGNGVKIIPEKVFLNCSSMTKIEIPGSVKAIKSNAFYGCSKLYNVVMNDSESVLSLEYNDWGQNHSGQYNISPLFEGCPLYSVYIGRKINYYPHSLAPSPFYRNTMLSSVTIADKETEIYENEFYGCTNLKNVRIGEGVTTIGDYAFSGCASLDFFAFGSRVQNIGKEAFSDCTAITKLISSAQTPPVCGSQALDDINKWECTLIVPEGRVDAYRAAEQWKEFFFIEEGNGIATDIEDNMVNNPYPLTNNQDVEDVYDLQGRKQGSMQPGLNIIRMSDGTTRKVVMK